jgi:HSP20 family protein
MNRKIRRFPFFDDTDNFGFDSDFDRLWNEMNTIMEQVRNNPDLAKGKPIYYGYSVEVGPDGVPHVKEFGNVKPVKNEGDSDKITYEPAQGECSTTDDSCGCNSPTAVETVHEPVTNDAVEPYTCIVFDDKKKLLKVSAEVPGISKDDIDLELEDDKLILKAKNDRKNYKKVLKLDQEVSQRNIKANYHNGVLEISFKCKKPSKKKPGKKIDVK